VVSFPLVSPPKPCIHLSLTCATCPAHLILLDLITLTILGEEYRDGRRIGSDRYKQNQPLSGLTFMR
jgi:hypothetical protein